jgi:integrase
MPAKHRFRPERETWEVIIRRPGEKKPERVKIGPGKEGEQQAIAFAARFNENELGAQRFTARTERDPLPIDVLLRDWLAARGRAMSKGYRKLADGHVRNHLVPFFGARDLRTTTEDDVVRYATFILDTGLSTAVAQHGLSILRRLCKLHARQIGGHNPFLGLEAELKKMRRGRTKRASERDAWTLQELLGIFELAREHEPWLYDKVIVASHTGCRKGELFGLRWVDVDFGRNQVAITGQIQDGEEELVKENDDQPKRIPMWAFGPELRRVLEELAEKRGVREPWREPGLVFLDDDGDPLRPDGYFRGAWKRLQERMVEAKIRPLTWHCFRHTFVTHLLEAGTSPKKVGEWVGHSTTYITEKYAHALPNAREGRGVLDVAKVTPLRSVPQ